MVTLNHGSSDGTKSDDEEHPARGRSVSRDLEESLAWLGEFGASGTSSLPLPSESVKHLEKTVEKLQIDLMKEQTTNATLEEEVNKLKEENQRLQEESQTAAGEFTFCFFL